MNNDWIQHAIFTDPIDDFRNNFYKKLDEEKKQKERELNYKQKNCWHRYTHFFKYNDNYSITVCEVCKHAKFTKN